PRTPTLTLSLHDALPIYGHVLPVSALLVPAVRHLADERDVRVDPHRAEAEHASRSQGPSHISRPHRRRQAVIDVVRPGDGLIVRSEEHTSELQSPCNLVC